MSRHYDRTAHYLVGEGFVGEDALLPESNLFIKADLPDAGTRDANRLDERRAFKFGRMFFKRSIAAGVEGHYRELNGLLELGSAMNEMPQGLGVALGKRKDDTPIPSGYTYLGQFLTHEITFDETKDLTTDEIADLNVIEQGRTPSIDLDSVYGRGPSDEKHRSLFYQDHARLKVGTTYATSDWNNTIEHDLPRGAGAPGDIRAVIPDPRNDENLALSQTHLAFIRFHNKIVDDLAHAGVAEGEQFERARELVVRHFQWIVLKHFLPKIIDERVLDCVLRSAKAHDGMPKFFKPSAEHGLYMPVEFSAAAFRLGHSMVRDSYEWNFFNSSDSFGPTPLLDLFTRGGFSGDLDGFPRLESKWVIDWRRFFDFREAGLLPDSPAVNRAKSIDTNFNFQLNTVPFYPHPSQEAFRPLTVRNLVRGFTLGLPTGQEIAAAVGVQVIPPDRLAAGAHAKILASYGFHEQTPLWYYILKEAELPEDEGYGGGGRRLGLVGSRIVAETIVGVIMQSDYSILKDDWTPKLGERKAQNIFDMTDLLKFTGIIDPIGK